MDVGDILGERLDDLWTDDQPLLNDEDASIVVVDTRMVRSRSDRHQIVREALDTVGAYRVGTNHHAQVVALEETVQVVWAEVHDVILLLWVSHVVMLEAILLLSLMWVRPEQVEDLLVVLGMISTELDLEWSLDLLNALDILNCWANTSMAAEDALLLISYNGCERHLLECLIDLGEDTVRVVNVLPESLGAFVTESKVLIHMFVLVVTSQEHDLLGILELECEEQANDLEGILALIYVISEEQVVEGVDISGVKRGLPDVEKPHEIDVLSMDITYDLYWGSDLLDDDWLSSQNLGTLVGKLNNVLSLAWELSSWLDILTLLWLQQRLQEHLT